jgi:hypothetical protein
MVDVNDSMQGFSTGPFWSGWSLTKSNALDWHNWAKDNGIEDAIEPHELHFTIIYCNSNPIDKKWPPPMQAAWNGKPAGIGQLGDALVVLFDAPQFIHSRFDQLNREWPHSFPTLVPHVSLTYDAAPHVDRIGSLSRALQQAPQLLQFHNEKIDVPSDPTEDKSGDISEVLFLTDFLKAFNRNRIIAKSYMTGDEAQYRKDWVNLLSQMAPRKQV